MKTGNLNQTVDFVLDIPMKIRFPRKRDHRSDFGTDDDVNLHLKRIGKTIETADILRDYGVYLGQHGSQFVVAIKDNISSVGSCEIFDSLEELKTEWELD